MQAKLLLAIALGLQSLPAFSYLDPGTGSMILQGIIAGIAVVGFAIKGYWHQILAFFGKKPPRDVLEATEDPNESDENV